MLIALAISAGLVGAAATIVIVTRSPAPPDESTATEPRDAGDTADATARRALGSRHDFSAEGLALSILVPDGATTSTRATGKGPTVHGHVDWPSALVTEQGRQFLDAPNVDVVESRGPCNDGNAPPGALVERNNRTPDGLVFSYREASGRHSGEVCNTKIGYHCTFNSVAGAIANKALAACMSVERVTGKAGSPPTATPSVDATKPITTAEVEVFLTGQVGAYSKVGAFVDAFSDSAVVLFPNSLQPYEGRAKIADGFRDAWLLPDPHTHVATSKTTIGIAPAIAWVTTEWRIKYVHATNPTPVRLTELITRGPTSLQIIAAHFSTPSPNDSAGITGPVPSFTAGVAAQNEPGSWLSSPVELSGRLLDDLADSPMRAATSVIGSDGNEVAIGTDAVRKLLASWKMKLEIVGNVRVIDGEGYKIVLAFARWRTSKTIVFRVLGLFVQGEPMMGPPPWQLATIHFSVANPSQR